MRYELRKTVALVGMMGSGKTAVGTEIARILDVPFLDSDRSIEEAASMTIAEIFTRDGEAFFRARETEVLSRLMSDVPAILSTGGGAFLSADNRNMMSEKGISVWLRADEELLWSRVRHKTTRPLLRTQNPRQTLHELCEARNPIYAKADVAVDASADYSIEQMAQKVIDVLAMRPDVLVRQSK